jgi:hypothetical protein
MGGGRRGPAKDAAETHLHFLLFLFLLEVNPNAIICYGIIEKIFNMFFLLLTSGTLQLFSTTSKFARAMHENLFISDTLKFIVNINITYDQMLLVDCWL